MEGIFSDAGNAFRNRDIFQVGALKESSGCDSSDVVGNRVTCILLPFRINIKRRLVFTEQNSIEASYIWVSRTYFNCRQAGAVPEGIIPEAGDAVRDCNTCQAAAFIKGFFVVRL